MKRRHRIYFTSEQKAEIWNRWRRGESMSSIGRGFDRNSSSIYPLLSRTGGIRPPDRTRSRLALSLVEREEISRGLRGGLSLRCIARQLGRSPSTIIREVKRNGGRRAYRAVHSDQAAWDRARRPKLCKLACNRPLSRTVARKLQLDWSPEQIAGWLKRRYRGEEHNQVSHETIYRSLYVQARGVLKKELMQHLRSKRTIRRSKHATLKRDGLGQITNAIPISERPANVEDRAVPGHWEGDLLGGSKNSYIATLVERHSRYVMLLKVPNKETQSVVSALIKQSQKLPRELYKSLTWDRGKELADHKRFTMATDIDVYFCDPHSPWQRGSNENTNRLLRQYLPKGTDLSAHSQAQLNKIARQLNERPRKTLQFETPAERFNQCVAATD
ncbi:MAG: IS30 family transposase [Pseudomonadota bacterium]